MKKVLILIALLLPVLASAQTESGSVRRGNRAFRKEKFSDADIAYRRGLNVDTTSARAAYNLANTLYREKSLDEAAKYMDQARRHIADIRHPAKQREMAHSSAFNAGDIALQQKDYQKAVQAFIEALVADPDDLDAKENYLYAKKMLQNQQQGGGGGNDQNQDQQQNQDQNQDQQDQKDQQQDQNQDQQQNQNQQQDQQNQDQNQQQDQPREQEISPQQAQQMLQAIQAKEKETQDKVKKEKAAALKSRQKEKNW